MNYFIADLHFGHKNALAYDNRKYKTIEENDSELITNWNSVVSEFDDVYILGDISWYNVTKTIEIIKKLNGNKHWIIGNHDNKLLKNRDLQSLFVERTHYKELDVDSGEFVILSHYPILFWNGQHRGNIHLYGHVHNTAEDNIFNYTMTTYEQIRDTTFNYLNVGCMLDYMDFTPKTLDEIKEIIKDRRS